MAGPQRLVSVAGLRFIPPLVPSRVQSTLRIVNVVATTNVSQRISLERLASVDGVFYAPEVYPCAYLKQEGMHGKVSVFASGRMISYGANCVSHARYDLRAAVRTLERIGAIRPTSVHVRVQNIVGCADLSHGIDLQRTALALPAGQWEYEPEQFPGLVYRVEARGLTLLLFGSGKLVCVGARSRAEVLEGIGRALWAVSTSYS